MRYFHKKEKKVLKIIHIFQKTTPHNKVIHIKLCRLDLLTTCNVEKLSTEKRGFWG